MTCPECSSAAAGHWHGYSTRCRGCWARMAARGQDFARVQANGRLDGEYLQALQRASLTHAEVKAAAAADAVMRNRELPPQESTQAGAESGQANAHP